MALSSNEGESSKATFFVAGMEVARDRPRRPAADALALPSNSEPLVLMTWA